MSITRVAACTVKGCPAPRDPDWHKPWCGHGLEGHHHHVPKRSQGGKRIVAFLCPKCHDEVDNGISLGNSVWKDKDGREHYLLWDVASGIKDPLIDRVLEAGSPAAEGRVALGPEPSALSAAAPPASGESSAAEPPVRGALPGPAGDSRLVPSSTAAPPSVFDLSSWCAEGMQLVYFGIALRDGQDEVRFRIGDWYNRGEGILGEETVGYLRGFEDVTVRQYSWVAGCVAPDTRVLELSWSYHRLVAALPAPKQKEWLDKARDENLTTRQLHQAIHGKKPKVKRWTLEELRELVKEFDDVEAADESEYTFTPPQFLNWLEAK